MCKRIAYGLVMKVITLTLQSLKARNKGWRGYLRNKKWLVGKHETKNGGSFDPPFELNFSYGTSFTLLQCAGRADYTNCSILLLNPHGNVGSRAAILIHSVGDYALNDDMVVRPNDVCEFDV